MARSFLTLAGTARLPPRREPEIRIRNAGQPLAKIAIDLLYADAAPAKQIIADFQPAFTKNSYLAVERALFKKERYKMEA
jgi:hypothetical protein